MGLRTSLFLILEDIEKYRYLVSYCIVSWKVWVPNNAVQEGSQFSFIVVIIIFIGMRKNRFSRSHMSHWYTIVILLVYHCVRIFISMITKHVFTLITRIQISAIPHFICLEKWYVQFYTKLIIYDKIFVDDNNNNR